MDARCCGFDNAASRGTGHLDDDGGGAVGGGGGDDGVGGGTCGWEQCPPLTYTP